MQVKLQDAELAVKAVSEAKKTLEDENKKQAQDFDAKVAEIKSKMAKELEQARGKTSNNQKKEKQLKDENRDLNNKLEAASQERANLQKRL